MFEVPAGGRRYRALQHLVKQKRLAKTAPVPCVARDASVDISAEEDGFLTRPKGRRSQIKGPTSG
jgi:ParB family chromosome partitioning protein